MRFKIREVDSESKWCRHLTLDLLHRWIPLDTVRAVLKDEGAVTPRERKLNLEVVLLWVIAMHLYESLELSEVLRKLTHGLGLLRDDFPDALPGASALTYRRYQLGARPLAALFRRVCRPMATPETPGAFRFGLRLMALDGAVEDVPDTPENVAAFGRPDTDRGESAFPQVQAVYLVECGTHAVVDAGFWPCSTSEKTVGFRLLRSVEPGMLVMWDRGLHDYERVLAVRERGAHVLSRLPAGVKLEREQALPDGSYLSTLRPSDPKRRRRGERMTVRVVEYRLDDPAVPSEPYRLVTTLLDPDAAPALEVARLYHERWEVELVIDETQTHQRRPKAPLRSRKPVGVIQELYGLLLAHYGLRFLMHEAALQEGIDPDRLSFTHTLRVVQDALPDFALAAPECVPFLHHRLLREILRGRLPDRRPRIHPRVVKRKMSGFALKREPHRHPPQPSRPFHDMIVLI